MSYEFCRLNSDKHSTKLIGLHEISTSFRELVEYKEAAQHNSIMKRFMKGIDDDRECLQNY